MEKYDKDIEVFLNKKRKKLVKRRDRGQYVIKKIKNNFFLTNKNK